MHEYNTLQAENPPFLKFLAAQFDSGKVSAALQRRSVTVVDRNGADIVGVRLLPSTTQAQGDSLAAQMKQCFGAQDSHFFSQSGGDFNATMTRLGRVKFHREGSEDPGQFSRWLLERALSDDDDAPVEEPAALPTDNESAVDPATVARHPTIRATKQNRNTESKLDAALALAAKGYRVFPLVPNGKTPFHPANWNRLATADPEEIRRLWTDPVFDAEIDCNIGIALDANTLVVDVDVRDGKQGRASLAEIERERGPLPKTRRVQTTSDGEHAYYNVEGNSGRFPKELAAHIDLKGAGGYVVGEGSTINGRSYRLLGEGPPASAPDWLKTLGRQARVLPKSKLSVPDESISSATEDRIIEWLVNHAPDHGTYAVSCWVKDLCADEQTCLALMMKHWPPAAAKGHEHVAFRVANAYRHGQNAPGVRNAELEFEPVEILDLRKKTKTSIPLQWITPFDADTIPPRRWLLGRFMARMYLSGLISPPGVGKTTFLLMLAVAMASGRQDITGFKVHERSRVLLWNQEDEDDELRRRLLAVMTAFDVSWGDLLVDGKPGLVMGSGVDRALMFARRTTDGRLVPTPDADAIEAFIREHGIGAAIFDPFVELHPAEENSNVEIAAVARIFRRIAVKAGCAVALAHHSRKPREAEAKATSYAGNMDTSRGAGALNGVARMVATLYGLDRETGKKFGIQEDECRRYVRFDDAKNNLGLVSGQPRFLRREGVTIGGFGGEEIGVLRPVELEERVSADTLLKTMAEVLAEKLTPGEWHKFSEVRKHIGGAAEAWSQTNANKALMRALDAPGVEQKEEGTYFVKCDKHDIEIVRKTGRAGTHCRVVLETGNGTTACPVQLND